MKAVLTLILVLFFGLTAFAQNTNTNDTMEPNKMDIVLDSGVITSNLNKEVGIASEKGIARLYKFKNSRVKKALAFTTKKDKPKLS
ncbi:hypothetical protein [Maribacter arenosus]|uniref:Uncharacterized protein n=1 Tax=Maribacter arenosus TaxID=1854708 RepID=A0ABR7VBL4_9FLAO|nr:hypothetical protein [Maribacter arenosus]MBD0851060.1 hypothetical protein [Maribacter arenosus]